MQIKPILKNGFFPFALLIASCNSAPSPQGAGPLDAAAVADGDKDEDEVIVVTGRLVTPSELSSPITVQSISFEHGLRAEDDPVEYDRQSEYRDAVATALSLYAQEREDYNAFCIREGERRPAVRATVKRRCSTGGAPIGAIYVAAAGDKVSINLDIPCFLNFVVFEKQSDGEWREIGRYQETLFECTRRPRGAGGA